TNPADITYGTALSAIQLNATAPIGGTFIYAPAVGTVLDGGAGQTLSVEFIPTDAVNYTSATKSVLINVSKTTATVMLDSLVHTYDGVPKSAAASTNPVGLTVILTYTGSATPPTNAGTYEVVGTISDINYQGSAAGTLVINKATAVVTLGSLNQTYDGAPKSATAGTVPTNLAVIFTYDGSGIAPTNAGSYVVVGIVDDVNYQGIASGTLVINKATAAVTLGSLNQTYDGMQKSATATTSPSGLLVDFTYDGSPAMPTNAGSYTVVGTVVSPNYEGSVSGTLVVNQATPVITWANPSEITYGTPLSEIQLNATANVSGIFEYSPSAGTILDIGQHQPLSVIFTPDDTINYTTASTTVHINVRN
ncbi:MAG TPA: MBG domain-containing protein, partial [Nitrospirota bacterium]